jgi:hypothetical protein
MCLLLRLISVPSARVYKFLFFTNIIRILLDETAWARLGMSFAWEKQAYAILIGKHKETEA